MSSMTRDEIRDFAESVSGALGRVWAEPQKAGEGIPLASVWDVAVAQGWTGLASQGALDAVLAACAKLGAAACPLPLADAFAAARLLVDHESYRHGIDSGTVRPLVVTEADVEGGKLRGVEAAELATHLVILPRTPQGPVRLREIGSRATTPGLAVPAWSDVVPGELVCTLDVSLDEIEDARAVLRLALAARAVGAVRRTHELATEHAKTRVQFGKPIGAFQMVAKRAVDGFIDVTAYDLLEQEATRLYPQNAWRLAGEVAVTHAVTSVPRVQFGAHHTLAAVGYFEEHEAPWLFRRAHADITRIGSFPLAAGEVADVLIESDAQLSTPGLGEDAEQFRVDVRAFMAATPIDATASLLDRDDVFVDALAARGYVAAGWSEADGGCDATVEQQMVLGEELAYHAAPGKRQRAASDIVGNAVRRHGTAEQKQRYLPLMAAGRFPFYLGYSEPEVGSDLARLRTRAEPDGDGWIINGCKMWGTGAHDAEYVWLAARTNPDAAKPHAGISVFLFGTDVPGWSKQEHRALSGEVSCTTFFDNVRVGPDALVGEVDGGWSILTAALSDERVFMAGLTAEVRRNFDDLVALMKERPELAGGRGSAARRTLSELAARLQSARLLVSASVSASAVAGAAAYLQAPMAKIVAGELAEDFGVAALQLLGPAGALGRGVVDVPGGGAVEYGLRDSMLQVIGGGTADIQRTLIARVLGLPR